MKASDQKALYERIYKESDIWLYRRAHGVHSVVVDCVRDELKGARVLDAGAGAGRLAIMCSFFAAEVEGFDFSETAVWLAQANARCAGATNVRFFVGDIDSACDQVQRPYDVVTLIGVLEHVADPLAVLRKLNRAVKPGGLLVVSCPNFLNFRGYSYMTLLTLFRLPMSLTDVRQVDYKDMLKWSDAAGFQVTRTLGALYRSAWDEKGVADMVKRVPLAVRDKAFPQGVAVDFDRYNVWLRSHLEVNRLALDYLERQGVLRRVQRPVEIPFTRAVEVDDALWAKMTQYIREDVESDPFYSDVIPFCYQGGEAIYLLKKAREVQPHAP